MTLLRGYGIECDLTCSELLAYLSGPTYTGDTVTAEQAACDDFLSLHDVAEACILKGKGYEVGEGTAVQGCPDTCRAHLRAVEVELREAERRSSSAA